MLSRVSTYYVILLYMKVNNSCVHNHHARGESALKYYLTWGLMAEAGHVLLDGVTVILRVAVNDRNKLKLHIERLAGLRAQRKLLISLSQGLDVIPKIFSLLFSSFILLFYWKSYITVLALALDFPICYLLFHLWIPDIFYWRLTQHLWRHKGKINFKTLLVYTFCSSFVARYDVFTTQHHISYNLPRP